MKYYSFVGGLALVATAILPTTVSAQGLDFSKELQNHRPTISIAKELGEFKNKKEKNKQNEESEHRLNAEVKTKELNGTVTAKEIRDLSLQARNATFDGRITSLGAGNFLLQSTNRGAQTVNMVSTTLIKKNGQTAVLADLVAGTKVRVSGIWNRANNVITASTVNIITRLRAISFTGTVTAKTDTSLTVTGTNNAVYAIDTTHARIVRRYFGRTDLREVSVGDKVTVWGKHEDTSTNIMAKLVQDLSISKKITTTTTSTVQ